MAGNLDEQNLPTLYYDDVSPPVRSCLMLIKMLDINVQLKPVNLFKGEQLQAEFVELNPAHTVPALVHGELVLTDSHVILLYLLENFRKDQHVHLVPKTDMERMRVLNMLFFEATVLFRHDKAMLSDIISKGFDKTDITFHRGKVVETYNCLEKYLQKHEFMAADHLTLADISIVTTLSTVNLICPLDKNKLPRLCAWFERMKALPEYEVNSKGLERLRQKVETMGKFKCPTGASDIN